MEVGGFVGFQVRAAVRVRVRATEVKLDTR